MYTRVIKPFVDYSAVKLMSLNHFRWVLLWQWINDTFKFNKYFKICSLYIFSANIEFYTKLNENARMRFNLWRHLNYTERFWTVFRENPCNIVDTSRNIITAVCIKHLSDVISIYFLSYSIRGEIVGLLCDFLNNFLIDFVPERNLKLRWVHKTCTIK